MKSNNTSILSAACAIAVCASSAGWMMPVSAKEITDKKTQPTAAVMTAPPDYEREWGSDSLPSPQETVFTTTDIYPDTGHCCEDVTTTSTGLPYYDSPVHSCDEGCTDHCVTTYTTYWRDDSTDYCEDWETAFDLSSTVTTITTTTTYSVPTGTSIEYENLVIKQLPDKVVYQIGEELDLTGGVFEGNGHIVGAEDIYYDWFYALMPRYKNMIDTSEFDSTKPGTYTIYIRGKKAVASFTVTVEEGALETTVTTAASGVVNASLWMEKMPDKTLYFVGDALDLTGALFNGGGTLRDENGQEIYYDWFTTLLEEHPELVYADEFDSTKPGIYTIYVRDEYAEASFDVQVIPALTKESGDANCDGKTTVSDAIMMARIAAEDSSVKITDNGKQYADMDGNGLLSGADTTLLLKMLADLL